MCYHGGLFRLRLLVLSNFSPVTAFATDIQYHNNYPLLSLSLGVALGSVSRGKFRGIPAEREIFTNQT